MLPQRGETADPSNCCPPQPVNTVTSLQHPCRIYSKPRWSLCILDASNFLYILGPSNLGRRCPPSPPQHITPPYTPVGDVIDNTHPHPLSHHCFKLKQNKTWSGTGSSVLQSLPGLSVPPSNAVENLAAHGQILTGLSHWVKSHSDFQLCFRTFFFFPDFLGKTY